MTLYYPIGLEALVEGNTQALQRGLIEVECSEELAAKLVPSMQPQPIPSDDPLEYVKINPYNITDLLVSKYLRLRGHPKFNRKTILQITDEALCWAHLQALSEPWEVRPKFEIADVGGCSLTRWKKAAISNLVNGTVLFPKGLTEAYKTFLSSILETKKPDDIPYDRDLLAPLNVIEAVVAHHIIAPLIKARLDTDHEVFHSIDKYIELLPTLPRVPVMLRGENEDFADYMESGAVADAWTKYCLLTSAMHDTYKLNSGLHCFRSHQLRESNSIFACRQEAASGTSLLECARNGYGGRRFRIVCLPAW